MLMTLPTEMRVLLLAQTRAELCGGPTLATLLVHGVAQLLRHHESGDRVISVCQASARRSYIDLMCASASSGIPAGLVGIAIQARTVPEPVQTCRQVLNLHRGSQLGALLADRAGDIVPVDPRDVADLSAWERWMAHAGYVSEGLLYLLIGTFALLAAMDASQGPNGAQGVLIRLSITGPGVLLVAAVALGLAAFVTWQLLIAIRDPEHRHDLDRRSRRVIR